MPVIPSYQRRMSIPSEGPNALQDVGSAALVGNSIAKFGMAGSEFIGLIQRQQEDLRKRRATVENSRLTNEANSFMTNQKIEFDTKANSADSSIGLATYAKEHEASIGPAFKDRIKFDEITDPDVLLHAQKLYGDVDAHFRDHTAVVQQKALGVFASKEIDAAVLNAVNMARAGSSPEESMKDAAQIIQDMHNTGVINTDKAAEFTVKAQQQVVSEYLNSLSATNPTEAMNIIKSGKYNKMMDSVTFKAVQTKVKTLSDMQTGRGAGVEIFKADTTGSLESMTDAVRAKKLDAGTEKEAIGQVKELYHERKIDEDNKKKAVFNSAYKTLTATALAGGGRLNKLSDIPQPQWVEMMAADPQTTMQIQNHISTEQRQKANMDKAAVRTAVAEQRTIQTDNANSLMADPERLSKEDLGNQLLTGKINGTQFKTLTIMQKNLDPVNSQQAKTAITALNNAKTKGLFNKNDKADNIKQWAEYSDMLYRYIQNNPKEDPALFVSEQIMKPVEVSFTRNLLDVVQLGTPGTDTAMAEKKAALSKVAGPKKERRKPAVSKEDALAELKRRGKI